MPCRQADCLRGYRKRGEGGEGMGAARGRVGDSRVQPSTGPEPTTETTLTPPSPCSPHPSPSSRVFVFFLLGDLPQTPRPTSLECPSHFLPPLTCPSPFCKGFITNKTANFSLVCERRNTLDSSPSTPSIISSAYEITSLLLPPPSGRRRKGEVKLGRGVGRENQPGRFLFFRTPSCTCDVSHKQCSSAGVSQHVTPHPTPPPRGSNASDRKARRTLMTSHSEYPRNDKSDTAQAAANTQDLWHFFAVRCDNSINDIVDIGIITIVIIY